MRRLGGFVTTGLVGWVAMLAIAVTLTVPAQAEISVSGPFVDLDTQGDWRGTYGNCFALIPDPVCDECEEPMGPDYFSDQHLQYRYTNCYEGPFFNNDPAKSQVDWRIYRNGEPPIAFAWHALNTIPASRQWNPCRDEFYHATWDNDTFSTDPLSVELKLNVEGDITLAYYFTNADSSCREQDYVLDIEGMTFSGTIGDFARGKYVYFYISGLETSEEGTTILFTSEDAPGIPMCASSPNTDSNTHISGVFIGGDCAAECPECGNGIVEEGEQCDLGELNGVPGSGCSADCKIVVEPDCSCEDGKPARLVFKYTGEDCDASNNDQDDFQCWGDPDDASPVYVEVVSDGAMATPNMVLLNETVAIVATDGRLKSNTDLEISDDSGVIQELTKIHTSCSQPLEVGDQFGSLLLVDFIPEGGTGVCGGDDEGPDGGDDEGADEGDDEGYDFHRGLQRQSANGEGMGGTQNDVQLSSKNGL